MASESPASKSSAPHCEACIVCLPSSVVRYDLDISLLYDFSPSMTRYNLRHRGSCRPELRGGWGVPGRGGGACSPGGGAGEWGGVSRSIGENPPPTRGQARPLGCQRGP